MERKVDNYIFVADKNIDLNLRVASSKLVPVYNAVSDEILKGAGKFAEFRDESIKNKIKELFGEEDVKEVVFKFGPQRVYQFLCDNGCSIHWIYSIFDKLGVDVSEIEQLKDSTFLDRMKEILFSIEKERAIKGRN